MNASSQTSSGALPTPAGVFAAYGAVLPVPLGTAAVTPQATPTGDPDVQAKQEADLVFTSESVQGIAATAYKLGVDDAKAATAELALLGQDPETLAWFHTRWRAAGQLCDGLDLDDMLKVGDVLTALDGRAPTVLPLTVTWNGTITDPVGDGPGETTLVGGTTARGSQAVLVLDDDARLQLGERLLATLHTAETCHTPGCGMAEEDLDASDPTVSGWVLVQVAGTGTDGPARWWCNSWCANSAITAGGAELAAADLAAATDPDAQAPTLPYDGDPLAYGPAGVRCGCGKDAHSNLVPCQPDAVADDQAALDGGL